jgi:hypothetical protein
LLLAAGTLALQWLDYQRLARAHSGDFYVFMIAAAFLSLGVWPYPFDGNFYVLAWEAALAVTGKDYGATFAAHMIEQRKAAGASAAEHAKYVAEMEQFKTEYATPLLRSPMTFTEIFPAGVLVSLITAGLLRKSPLSCPQDADACVGATEVATLVFPFAYRAGGCWWGCFSYALPPATNRSEPRLKRMIGLLPSGTSHRSMH